MSTKYKDEIHDLKKTFKDEADCRKYFDTLEFVEYCKALGGLEVPVLFQCKIESLPEPEYFIEYVPTKNGIPMDWHFFSEQVPITVEDIEAETNIEKRTLLMMEYGVANYLNNITILHEDVYGVLLEADMSGERQKFVKVTNGTPETLEKQDYYRDRGMLGKNGCRLYYIPVGNEGRFPHKWDGQKVTEWAQYPITTAKQAVASSWEMNPDLLPEAGWDFES